MLQGLNFVLVHVADMAEARAFYTETLGLHVESEAPGFIQFAQPGGQGATFALSLNPDARPSDQPELWWYVDDADGEHARLAQAGVTTLTPPKDEPFGRTFTLKDPAGNTLYVLKLRQS